MANKPTTTANKTLVQKLHDGYQYFTYLQKDKQNTFHKYKYVSEANLKEHAQKMCRELGILFKYSIDDYQENVIQKNDAPIFSSIVKIHYYFINVDDPNDYIEGISYGAAQDSGDKGLYKALTGGLKYIFFTTFLVPSGEEPENDDIEEQIEKATITGAPLTQKTPQPKRPVNKKELQNKKDALETIVEQDLGGKLLVDPKAQTSSTPDGDDIQSLRAKFMSLQLSPQAKKIIEDMDKCTTLDELKGVWMLIPSKERTLAGVTEFKDIKKHELMANK